MRFIYLECMGRHYRKPRKPRGNADHAGRWGGGACGWVGGGGGCLRFRF